MAIEFSYRVNNAMSASQGNLTDVIKQVNFTVIGEDDGAKFSLPTSCELADADPNNFTAFDQLTEAQIIGWVENLTTTNAIKDHVAMVMEKEKSKLVLENKRLPWKPVVEAAPMPPTDPAPPTPPTGG